MASRKSKSDEFVMVDGYVDARTHSPAAPATPPPFGVVGVAASDLPLWAVPHRALIGEIVAARPDDDLPLSQLATGQIASFGFRGRKMAQLRQAYGEWFDQMLQWVGAVPFGSDQYHARRNALIAFEKANGPDALVKRMLAQ